MYSRGRLEGHAPATFCWRTRSADAHISCVRLSLGEKLPATVLLLLPRRAVSSKPQRRARSSVTVTTRCCLVPGVYDRPSGKDTVTLPPPLFTAEPAWQPS